MHRPYLKNISALLIICFLSQDISWAAQEISANFSPQIKLSSEYAKTVETHKGKLPKQIILIQDAHTNFSAQKNLAKIIEELVTRHRVSTVFTEGGSGDDSLTSLRGLADKKVRERVSRRYMMQGTMSGDEYLSLSTDLDLKIRGVEDMVLYKKNLEYYRSVSHSRDEVWTSLHEIEKRIDTLKRQLYPGALLALDEAVSGFEDKKVDFTAYYDALTEAARGADVNLLGYPQFLSLGTLKEKEAALDLQKIGEEQGRLYQSLQRADAPRALELKKRAMSAQKVRYQTGASSAFFRELVGLAKEHGLVSEHLEKYVGYLEQYEALHVESLMEETRQLEDEIFARGLTGDTTIFLHAADGYLKCLRKLFSLQATRDEVEAYQESRKDSRYKAVSLIAFVNRALYDLGREAEVMPYQDVIEKELKAVEGFYETTRERDKAFVRTTLEWMGRDNITSAALLAGGYHTGNIKKLLEEQGVSYLVVSPLVTEETDQKRYEKLLLSQFAGGAQTMTGPMLNLQRSKGFLSLIKFAERPGAWMGGLRQELAGQGARLSNIPVDIRLSRSLLTQWGQMTDAQRSELALGIRRLVNGLGDPPRSDAGQKLDPDRNLYKHSVSQGTLVYYFNPNGTSNPKLTLVDLISGSTTETLTPARIQELDKKSRDITDNNSSQRADLMGRVERAVDMPVNKAVVESVIRELGTDIPDLSQIDTLYASANVSTQEKIQYRVDLWARQVAGRSDGETVLELALEELAGLSSAIQTEVMHDALDKLKAEAARRKDQEGATDEDTDEVIPVSAKPEPSQNAATTGNQPTVEQAQAIEKTLRDHFTDAVFEARITEDKDIINKLFSIVDPENTRNSSTSEKVRRVADALVRFSLKKDSRKELLERLELAVRPGKRNLETFLKIVRERMGTTSIYHELKDSAQNIEIFEGNSPEGRPGWAYTFEQDDHDRLLRIREAALYIDRSVSALSYVEMVREFVVQKFMERLVQIALKSSADPRPWIINSESSAYVRLMANLYLLRHASSYGLTAEEIAALQLRTALPMTGAVLEGSQERDYLKMTLGERSFLGAEFRAYLEVFSTIPSSNGDMNVIREFAEEVRSATDEMDLGTYRQSARRVLSHWWTQFMDRISNHPFIPDGHWLAVDAPKAANKSAFQSQLDRIKNYQRVVSAYYANVIKERPDLVSFGRFELVRNVIESMPKEKVYGFDEALKYEISERLKGRMSIEQIDLAIMYYKIIFRVPLMDIPVFQDDHTFDLINTTSIDPKDQAFVRKAIAERFADESMISKGYGNKVLVFINSIENGEPYKWVAYLDRVEDLRYIPGTTSRDELLYVKRGSEPKLAIYTKTGMYQIDRVVNVGGDRQLVEAVLDRRFANTKRNNPQQIQVELEGLNIPLNTGARLAQDSTRSRLTDPNAEKVRALMKQITGLDDVRVVEAIRTLKKNDLKNIAERIKPLSNRRRFIKEIKAGPLKLDFESKMSLQVLVFDAIQIEVLAELDDPTIVLRAIADLGELGTPSALDLILAVYERSKAEPRYRIRRAAMQAFEKNKPFYEQQAIQSPDTEQYLGKLIQGLKLLSPQDEDADDLAMASKIREAAYELLDGDMVHFADTSDTPDTTRIGSFKSTEDDVDDGKIIIDSAGKRLIYQLDRVGDWRDGEHKLTQLLPFGAGARLADTGVVLSKWSPVFMHWKWDNIWSGAHSQYLDSDIHAIGSWLDKTKSQPNWWFTYRDVEGSLHLRKGRFLSYILNSKQFSIETSSGMLYLTVDPSESGKRGMSGQILSLRLTDKQIQRVVNEDTQSPEDTQGARLASNSNKRVNRWLLAAPLLALGVYTPQFIRSRVNRAALKNEEHRLAVREALRPYLEGFDLTAAPEAIKPEHTITTIRIAITDPLNESELEKMTQEVLKVQANSPAKSYDKIFLSEERVRRLVRNRQVLTVNAVVGGEYKIVAAIFFNVSKRGKIKKYAQISDPKNHDVISGDTLYDFWVITDDDYKKASAIPFADTLIHQTADLAERAGWVVMAYSRPGDLYKRLRPTEKRFIQKNWDRHFVRAYRARIAVQHLLKTRFKRDEVYSTKPFEAWLSTKYKVDLDGRSKLANDLRPILKPSLKRSINPARDKYFARLIGLLFMQFASEVKGLDFMDPALGKLHTRLGGHLVAIYFSRDEDENALGLNAIMSYEAVDDLDGQINRLMYIMGYSKRVSGARLAENPEAVMVLDDALWAQGAAKAIADEVVQAQSDGKIANVVFAYGKTQVPMLKHLIDDIRIDWTRVRIFHGDELVGLDKDDPGSGAHFFEEHLVGPLRAKAYIFTEGQNLFYIDTKRPDLENSLSEYVKRLADLGGADVMTLGIGRNGHIYFNEPGTAFDAEAHIADLIGTTLEDNPAAKNDPRALTFGPADVKRAKKVFMLITGPSKTEPTYKFLEGPIGVETPASFLRTLPDEQVRVILDRSASVIYYASRNTKALKIQTQKNREVVIDLVRLQQFTRLLLALTLVVFLHAPVIFNRSNVVYEGGEFGPAVFLPGRWVAETRISDIEGLKNAGTLELALDGDIQPIIGSLMTVVVDKDGDVFVLEPVQVGAKGMIRIPMGEFARGVDLVSLASDGTKSLEGVRIRSVQLREAPLSLWSWIKTKIFGPSRTQPKKSIPNPTDRIASRSGARLSVRSSGESQDVTSIRSSLEQAQRDLVVLKADLVEARTKDDLNAIQRTQKAIDDKAVEIDRLGRTLRHALELEERDKKLVQSDRDTLILTKLASLVDGLSPKDRGIIWQQIKAHLVTTKALGPGPATLVIRHLSENVSDMNSLEDLADVDGLPWNPVVAESLRKGLESLDVKTIERPVPSAEETETGTEPIAEPEDPAEISQSEAESILNDSARMISGDDPSVIHMRKAEWDVLRKAVSEWRRRSNGKYHILIKERNKVSVLLRAVHQRSEDWNEGRYSVDNLPWSSLFLINHTLHPNGFSDAVPTPAQFAEFKSRAFDESGQLRTEVKEAFERVALKRLKRGDMSYDPTSAYQGVIALHEKQLRDEADQKKLEREAREAALIEDHTRQLTELQRRISDASKNVSEKKYAVALPAYIRIAQDISGFEDRIIVAMDERGLSAATVDHLDRISDTAREMHVVVSKDLRDGVLFPYVRAHVAGIPQREIDGLGNGKAAELIDRMKNAFFAPYPGISSSLSAEASSLFIQEVSQRMLVNVPTSPSKPVTPTVRPAKHAKVDVAVDAQVYTATDREELLSQDVAVQDTALPEADSKSDGVKRSLPDLPWTEPTVDQARSVREVLVRYLGEDVVSRATGSEAIERQVFQWVAPRVDLYPNQVVNALSIFISVPSSVRAAKEAFVSELRDVVRTPEERLEEALFKQLSDKTRKRGAGAELLQIRQKYRPVYVSGKAESVFNFTDADSIIKGDPETLETSQSAVDYTWVLDDQGYPIDILSMKLMVDRIDDDMHYANYLSYLAQTKMILRLLEMNRTSPRYSLKDIHDLAAMRYFYIMATWWLIKNRNVLGLDSPSYLHFSSVVVMVEVLHGEGDLYENILRRLDDESVMGAEWALYTREFDAVRKRPGQSLPPLAEVMLIMRQIRPDTKMQDVYKEPIFTYWVDEFLKETASLKSSAQLLLVPSSTDREVDDPVTMFKEMIYEQGLLIQLFADYRSGILKIKPSHRLLRAIDDINAVMLKMPAGKSYKVSEELMRHLEVALSDRYAPSEIREAFDLNIYRINRKAPKFASLSFHLEPIDDALKLEATRERITDLLRGRLESGRDHTAIVLTPYANEVKQPTALKAVERVRRIFYFAPRERNPLQDILIFISPKGEKKLMTAEGDFYDASQSTIENGTLKITATPLYSKLNTAVRDLSEVLDPGLVGDRTAGSLIGPSILSGLSVRNIVIDDPVIVQAWQASSAMEQKKVDDGARLSEATQLPVVDENGEVTGRVIHPSERYALKPGEYVHSAVVFFLRRNGDKVEVLAQHRARGISPNQDFWDATAAGRREVGEDIALTAKRELHEESRRKLAFASKKLIEIGSENMSLDAPGGKVNTRFTYYIHWVEPREDRWIQSRMIKGWHPTQEVYAWKWRALNDLLGAAEADRDKGHRERHLNYSVARGSYVLQSYLTGSALAGSRLARQRPSEPELLSRLALTDEPRERLRLADMLFADTRPISSGLLDAVYVLHDMKVRSLVNPLGQAKTALYKGAGADISNYLLSIDAPQADFESYYYGLDDLDLDLIRHAPLKGLADSAYSLAKFEGGFGLVRYMTDLEETLIALTIELNGMGVDFRTIRTDIDDRGYPRLSFVWANRMRPPQRYYISFIDLYSEDKPQYRDKYDIFYQRAGIDIAEGYVSREGRLSYMYDVASRLEPGGFFVTDDFTSRPSALQDNAFVLDYADRFPFLLPEIPVENEQLYEDAVRRLRAYIEDGSRDDNYFYGWKVRVRQNTADGKLTPNPRAQVVDAKPADAGQWSEGDWVYPIDVITGQVNGEARQIASVENDMVQLAGEDSRISVRVLTKRFIKKEDAVSRGARLALSQKLKDAFAILASQDLRDIGVQLEWLPGSKIRFTLPYIPGTNINKPFDDFARAARETANIEHTYIDLQTGQGSGRVYTFYPDEAQYREFQSAILIPDASIEAEPLEDRSAILRMMGVQEGQVDLGVGKISAKLLGDVAVIILNDKIMNVYKKEGGVWRPAGSRDHLDRGIHEDRSITDILFGIYVINNEYKVITVSGPVSPTKWPAAHFSSTFADRSLTSVPYVSLTSYTINSRGLSQMTREIARWARPDSVSVDKASGVLSFVDYRGHTVQYELATGKPSGARLVADESVELMGSRLSAAVNLKAMADKFIPMLVNKTVVLFSFTSQAWAATRVDNFETLSGTLIDSSTASNSKGFTEAAGIHMTTSDVLTREKTDLYAVTAAIPADLIQGTHLKNVEIPVGAMSRERAEIFISMLNNIHKSPYGERTRFYLEVDAEQTGMWRSLLVGRSDFVFVGQAPLSEGVTIRLVSTEQEATVTADGIIRLPLGQGDWIGQAILVLAAAAGDLLAPTGKFDPQNFHAADVTDAFESGFNSLSAKRASRDIIRDITAGTAKWQTYVEYQLKPVLQQILNEARTLSILRRYLQSAA